MIFNTIAAVIALVLLFLFAIQKFSKQVQHADGEAFKSALTSLTENPLRGTIVGTVITVLIQSSTAVSVMMVGLVNAGLVSFYNSLGVIFGAHLGTTITTHLIAFKLTYIAPYIVIIGFLIDRFAREKYRRYGKPIFYFGLVFFSLALISEVVIPLQSDPTILSLIGKINNFWIALVVGIGMTVLFQASSLVIGIAIILVGSGLLTLDQALGIVLGANIGTTSTVLISAIGMEREARRTAVAHALFSVLGVLILLPFSHYLVDVVKAIGGDSSLQIANFHMFFNIMCVSIFLIFIKPFATLVKTIIRK